MKNSKNKKGKERPIVRDIAKLNKSVKATPEELVNAIFSVPSKPK